MKQFFLIATFIGFGMMVNAQTFQWAKEFNGNGNNAGYSLVQNSAGEMYISGSFEGTVDFDAGDGVYNLTAFGDRDAFIEKMDADGNFMWVKQIGGTDSDYVRNSCLDNDGNIFITGSFKGISDMDPGDDDYYFTSLGGEDMFVLELDEDGNFVWAGHMGGPLDDHATSISIAPSGNIYIAGYFLGMADFDPSDTAEYYLQATGQAIFVEKLNINKQFIWAGMMGGSGFDYCQNMCLDDDENVYTIGMFGGTADFDPGDGTEYLNAVGDRDIFVSNLNSDGEYVWAKSMGGNLIEAGQFIEYDNIGNLLLTGNFQGTVDFDPGEGNYYMTSMGDYDIFIGKLDMEGNMVWMKQIGGAGSDGGWALALDSDNNVYSTGYFSETADFNPGDETFEMTSFGDIDIFVSKLDESGNFVWAADMGGELYDRGLSIITDDQSNIITTGMFEGTADFDPSGNNYYLNGLGDYDVFISRLGTELLGLDKKESNNFIIAYPNPVSQYFQLDFGEIISEVSVSIYNVNGQELLNKKYTGQKKVTIEFDGTNGLYFIKTIKDDGHSNTLKIIKQ